MIQVYVQGSGAVMKVSPNAQVVLGAPPTMPSLKAIKAIVAEGAEGAGREGVVVVRPGG